MQAIKSKDIEALISFAKDQKEPDWLIKEQVVALENTKTASLPKFQRFDYRGWQLTPRLINYPNHQLSSPTVETSTTVTKIVQLADETLKIDLPEKLISQGVILTDIFTAFRQHSALIKSYFMNVIKADENQLTSYHLAHLNAGIFLYVPENVVIDQPVEMEIIQDSKKQVPLVSHLLIVAGPSSKFAVTQHLSTRGDHRCLANTMVEIVAEKNSEVKLTSLDELSQRTTVSFNRRAFVRDNAEVDWTIGLMNAGNTIGQTDTDLVGEGSKTDTKVIAITGKDQRVGINTKITNRGKHSVGNILQRGVLLGQSELIFNGIGDIIHGASGANAEQENRILMMSPGTHGDANPILLIDENDVLAGHAASVGQVDQQQMYYLMSRGIDKRTASHLVIRGFLGAVLTAIPSKNVRKQLIEIIERNLKNG
ncbi:Fe-S cluster assembly protein SufD [Lentilactobacillus diolivorans]|uniref:ABC transporter component n=2 Tax=Lentilactobacillus diolivorans TaxID=179838 RepID=A0A0R1SIT2_9LACO|nr:Fe-S cluster assembly protein SufD [Lentilactobacillus diolivorans]KRL69072.1 ABC transporter component [Lentilactobacillus diolivorans DSM 14421]GEP22482.1 Fe-S cluster assembly protein SufD [Lentilactobacillus diolivorans]